MPRTVLGLDIGGANLKAAHTGGACRFHRFALWRNPAGLIDAMRTLVQAMPSFEVLAVTMTGELCDCFETKRQGVWAILDAAQAVAGNAAIVVWRNDGELVNLAAARADPLKVAAANWLALATYAGRFAPKGTSLLVDIGWTTTDVVPLSAGRPVPRGRTDPERLLHHELVYTGVRRTPVCAVVESPVAAELFATTLDVYLVLEMTEENASDQDTADGRPATRTAAHVRLARMLCADLESSTEKERRGVAERALRRQMFLVSSALEKVSQRLPQPPNSVILAGSGEFLARTALQMRDAFPMPRVISLSETLGSEISRVACAHALAVITGEQDHATK